MRIWKIFIAIFVLRIGFLRGARYALYNALFRFVHFASEENAKCSECNSHSTVGFQWPSLANKCVATRNTRNSVLQSTTLLNAKSQATLPGFLFGVPGMAHSAVD